MPRNDHQTVIKQQPSPSPTVMKASVMFLMTGDSDAGKHIRPINKPGPQEFFPLKKSKKG